VDCDREDGNVMAKTKIRTVRVPDDLWAKAHARARREGDDLSALIRFWLTLYIQQDSSTGESVYTSQLTRGNHDNHSSAT
jgi:hypothetical protein